MLPSSNRQVDVVGVPLDLGAGKRGVDMGPSAIRYADLARGLTRLGWHVRDRGNLPAPFSEELGVGDPRARYAAEVGQICAALATSVRAIVVCHALRPGPNV